MVLQTTVLHLSRLFLAFLLSNHTHQEASLPVAMSRRSVASVATSFLHRGDFTWGDTHWSPELVGVLLGLEGLSVT